MHLRQSPFEALHLALASAQLLDLSAEKTYRRDAVLVAAMSAAERDACAARAAALGPYEGQKAWPGKMMYGRPSLNQLVVVAMFPQTWGSTSIGFGGLGGAAMTTAYTVVLTVHGTEFAVYFGGRFAYLVSTTEALLYAKFQADLAANSLASVAAAGARYGAVATTKLPGAS